MFMSAVVSYFHIQRKDIYMWISTRTTSIVFVFALSACSTLPANSEPQGLQSTVLDAQGKAITELMNCDGGLKYIPVPAFEAKDYTTIKMVGTTPTPTRVDFPSTTADVNKLLPNLSMDVSNEEVDGGVSFFFKSDLKHRRIVMDFMKSRTEPIVDSGNNFYGYGRVGAGLRLKIDLLTSESSFDGSLIGLAASARAKTASGHITAETVGVDNSDVTLSMPFSTDFSEGSIQKVIEALAVIKSRLHDPKTTLVPHFLARVTCSKQPATTAPKPTPNT
jgi:hypothetical protein